MVQWEHILAVFKYNMCAPVQLNGTGITSFFWIWFLFCCWIKL